MPSRASFLRSAKAPAPGRNRAAGWGIAQLCLLAAVGSGWFPAGASAAPCRAEVPQAAAERRVSTAIAGSDSYAAAVVAEVNARRCLAGVGPVRLEQRATAASLVQSRWMAANGRMEHETDLPGRKTFPARLKAEQIRLRTGGFENIANLRRFGVAGLGCAADRPVPTEAELARAVVDLWMSMPVHRRQTLDSKVVYAGGGATVSERPGSCGTIFLALVLFG